MSNVRLADLLGAKENTIRWERPLLFFTALFLSDISGFVIGPPLVNLIFPSDRTFGFALNEVFGTADELLRILLFNMVLAGAAFIVFRVVSNDFIAIPIVAVIYGFAARLIDLGMMSGWNKSITFWERQSLLLLRPQLLLVLTLATLWAVGLLAGIAVMVRLLQPLWLALLLGAVVGLLIPLPFRIAMVWSSPNSSMRFLSFYFFSAVIFAVAFWAGLRITSYSTSLISVSSRPRLATAFYLGAIASLVAVVEVLAIMIVGESIASSSVSRYPVPLLIAITFLLMILGVVVIMVLVYKMWAAIQDGHARTSPGRAVGLLFIPLANLIWMFQVFPGFAKDFNAFVKRHAFNVPLLPTGLFTAYCVITLCAVIPFLGLLFSVIDYFVLLAMVSKICDAVNAIPESAVTATSVSPT